MIVQPATVELTKIHYYDKKPIPTISREVFENHFNANTIIKRNIFGHKWVLKINESAGQTPKPKKRLKLVIYVLVFCCIVIAVCFGIFFTLERELRRRDHVNETKSIEVERPSLTQEPPALAKRPEKSSTVTPAIIKATRISSTIGTASQRSICANCDTLNTGEICLKMNETEMPQCRRPIDPKDPTGCGGFCSINTQFCKLLDAKNRVYQCQNNTSALKCPSDSFNCGNRCISLVQKCDGTIHCSNRSDEVDCECNLKTHFQCGNSTSCLERHRKCDGTVDCWDKSDEIGCKAHCEEGTAPCMDGGCIPKAHICDGVFHCKDHSDEPPGCQF